MLLSSSLAAEDCIRPFKVLQKAWGLFYKSLYFAAKWL